MAESVGNGALRSMRILSLALALFVFWLLLSGHYDPFLVVAGAITSLVIAMLGTRLGYADEEGHPVELIARGFLYWPWLVKEIVVSAIDVARRILSPGLPIAPRLVTVRAGETTAVGLVTYANSITLTPGTITVGVDRAGRRLTVHALTEEGAAALAAGEMDRRVKAFEVRG